MGFPSPAQDYYHGDIDLNVELIANRSNTHLMTMCGDTMLTVGIFNGDEMLVGRARTPLSGDVIVARTNGEMVVARLGKDHHGTYLDPDNPRHKREYVNGTQQLQICEVVILRLHKLA